MQIILNQLVYFGFFQSLLLLVIYVFSPRNKRHINGYMAFLIFTLLIGLTGKVLHSAGFWGGNFRLIAMSEFSALLFGTTIYLFTRSVLLKKEFNTQDLTHYIPGFAYSVFILVYFIIPDDQILVERSRTGELMRVIYICHAVGLIVNLTYWGLSLKLSFDFLKDMRNECSYELHSCFLRNFLVITGVCFFIWTILFVISLSGFDMLERNARPYIWIVLTLIILFITFYTIISPQVLRMLPEVKPKKYNLSKFDTADLERLKEKLENLMNEKKPYLNSKLLKNDLARMLEVNSPELSRLLSENIGMNFFEYVNYYRIKEFITLASSEKAKQFTFFGLAQEAGFNSKTTFNKSFKKLTGTSPSMYFKNNL